MELHISSDDMSYITDIYSYAEDNIDNVDGYVSLYGYDMNGELHHRVNINRSEVGNQFPKQITFGQMLDIMKQAGRNTVYFQREDWRNTHNCIAMNNSQVSELYLEIFYEDNRYAKGHEQTYEPNEVPIDSHPYIPTYDDMFKYSWVVYGDNYKSNDGEVYEEKSNVNSDTP
jgi:hypothetical protein